MINQDFLQLAQYHHEAQNLLGRFNWSLLDAYELGERAADLVDITQQQPSIDYACLRAYAAELHRVINGENQELLEQAFTELWNYLVPIAQKKGARDRQEEFAQRTLVKVWEKRSQCRKPTSFLAWATLILINEIRQDYRAETRQVKDVAEKKRVVREEVFTDLEGEDGREGFRNVGVDQVEEKVLRQEAYQRFRDVLHETLASANQTTAIMGLFLEDRSPVELAEEMQCTMHNVYVHKSRALKRLRLNPQVLVALQDLIETYPEDAS